MRLTFSAGDPKNVKDFFTGDSAYIDILVARDRIFLIMASSSSYAHKVFRINKIEDFTNSMAFRVGKKEFLSFLMEGLITIYAVENKLVEISFSSQSELNFNIKLDYESSNVSLIKMYKQLIDDRNKYTTVDKNLLAGHLKLVKSFGTFFDIIDGVLQIESKKIKAFTPVTGINSLSLTSSNFTFVMQNSTHIYRYREYFIGFSEDSVSIVKINRGKTTSDYPWIEKAMVLSEFIFDLTPVSMLCKRTTSDNLIALDFNREVVKTIPTSSKEPELSAPLKVHKKLVRAKKEKPLDIDSIDFSSESTLVDNSLPIYLLPIALFKELVADKLKTRVSLSITKNFVILKSEGEKGGTIFVTGTNYVRS